MAVTVRGSGWGGASTNTSELLIGYIRDEIKVLEPQLQYARLGVRRDSPKGYDRIVFPQTNQVPIKINVSIEGAFGGSVWGAGASVEGQAAVAPGAPVSSTNGVAAITEGTNPTAISWGATSFSSGPYQFGVLISVSDLLVHNSALDVITSCTEKVRDALARLVDTAIQTVVNSGTNGVIYAGGRTARTSLGAGDLITQSEMTKAYRNLASANAAGLKPFEGKYFAAVIHPFAESDLMSNTQTGAFVDVGRYTSVDDLRAGAMGDFRGVRYLRSAWQNYFKSTVNVFPTTVLGAESFGWGFFQEPTPILITTPDSYNGLNLYSTIGGKVALGITRFEDALDTYRVVRVESAVSS